MKQRTDRASIGGARELLMLAYPVMLAHVSTTAMGLVDSAIVGSLGATELGAVGFGGIWLSTFVCVLVGTATGVQTFVAQRHGAGALRACGAWTWQGVFAVVPFAAALSVAVLAFAAPLVAQLGSSAALASEAVAYVCARAPGIIGLTLAAAVGAFFRGIGDTKTPLRAALFANAANAVLDYGLVFGELGLPRWEVAGAGAATAIAEWLQAGVLLVPFLARPAREAYGTTACAPAPRRILRLLRTAAPIGGQWWLEMAAFAVFTAFVARMGDASMAASQAFVALQSLSLMQAVGLGIGVSTLVGRYIGAGEPEVAARAFRSGLALGVSFSAAIGLVFCAFPEPLLRLFTDDARVIALGRPLLVVGALFQLCDAFGIVADGALRGAGDTRWPFGVRLVLAWGIFVPLAWWAGIARGGGLVWVWAAAVVHVAMLSAAFVWRFQSGAWTKVRI